MPFEIVRNDITRMAVDAIVNTANPRPVIGLGTDSMIHEAAGPGLLQARQAIGPMDIGQAAITPAFNLQAKYVIHTVGPVWDGGSYGEEMLLRSCYENALHLAVQNGCRSVAFPQINYAVVLAYMPGKKTEYDDYSDTMLPEGIETVHPHYAISWRNNWMLRQSDYVVTYITHSWGGATQYAKKAKSQKKIAINLV